MKLTGDQLSCSPVAYEQRYALFLLVILNTLIVAYEQRYALFLLVILNTLIALNY
jgi:hypothetical protein